MTDTLNDVTADKQGGRQQRLAEQLLAQAKEQGVDLAGPDGLLNQLTKKVLETARSGRRCRSTWATTSTTPSVELWELAQRGSVQDGADRDRASRDRRAPRRRRIVRPADRRSCG
jgi:hypothetical protein